MRRRTQKEKQKMLYFYPVDMQEQADVEQNIKCESSFNASWPGFLKTPAEFGAVGMMAVEEPLQHRSGSGDLE